MQSRSVAIIPARGGSKRIPGKNIRRFSGRPIIQFAIECARDSGLFEAVIVSTDSNEIAEIAEKAGALVPFIRPDELSNDHASTEEVLAHAINCLGGAVTYDYACCIYATTPFLRIEDLRKGLETLQTTDAHTVLSVSSFAAPILRSFSMDEEQRLTMNWPDHRITRTQDLPEAFHDAGQFYWVNVLKFLSEPILFSSDLAAVRLPRWRVHDIDNEEDWKRAELVYEALMRSKPN